MSQVKTTFDGVVSAEEAMSKAGLDWVVNEVELITSNGIDVPKHKGLVRSDTNTVLGVVGKGWEPMQNHESFALMDTLVQEFGGTYKYAFNINGGQRVATQIELGEKFEARNGDAIGRLLTIFNAHDGSGSYLGYMGHIRYFCTNTTRALMEDGKNCIRLRHTASLKERVEEALRFFRLGAVTLQAYEEKAKYLAQKLVDRAMVKNFLDEVIGSPIKIDPDTKEEIVSVRIQNKRDAVVDLFENGKGNRGESAWDLYHGTTEFIDHHTNLTNDNRRYNSALFGEGMNVKDKALEVALAL